MKKIIIDTNALMAIAQFKMDIFSALEKWGNFRYQTYLLSGTLEELEKILAKQKGKNKTAAKLALKIVKLKKIPVLIAKGDVDKLLVKYSQEGALILTQDQLLKKKLNRPYLTIRQKKKIVIIE